MRRGARGSFLAALAGLALGTAGSSAPAAESAAGAQGAALGKTLAGETCRLNGVVGVRPVDILCGTSMEPAGSLQASSAAMDFPADSAARRDAILRSVRAMEGGLGIPGQMTCDAGQALGQPADGNALLFLCSLQSNSWPRILLVAAHGRTVYRAEGLPGTLPVLQAAIAGAAGRKTIAAETEAGQRLLAARLPGAVLQASNSDFSNYRQFVELGRLYSSADNFAGAETAYRNALGIETKLFGPNAVTVGQTLAELALQVSNQRRFNEAAELFRRATPIIAAAPSVSVRARLASYRALDSANQRDFVNALNFARDATALRRVDVDSASATKLAAGGPSVGPAASEGELAHSLRIEAEMALRLGDLAGAQAAAEEALWIISQEPGLPLWWRPDVVALMADINARRGRVTIAERDYKDALKLNQDLFGETAPTALMQLRIGQFYVDQQLYPAGIASFRAAFAILAKDPVARSEVVPDQILPFLLAASQPSIDPAQRPALDTEIFRASQLVRSDVADQTIARAAARRASDNPALSDLVRQAQEAERARANLRMDLAAEYAKTDDQRNGAREAALADQLKSASAKTDQLLTKLNQAFPDYAKFADPGPAELADVEVRLEPGEAFLSFVIGVRGSYALLVKPQGLTVRRLDVRSEQLSADIAELRRAFVLQLGAAPDFSLRGAFALYRQVLEPLEKDLAGVSHLTVAPGGDLASLPFALLVTAAPREGAERDYANAPWLVRRVALTQIPSPRAFLSLRDAQRKRVPAPRPFLGVGNPTFVGGGGSDALSALAAGCRENGPAAPELLRALPPLRDTAEEVNTAARVLGGGDATVLLAADATESRLRAEPLEQYQVLYFATHGLLPGELHCQSEPGLVLSPPAVPADTTAADGLLEASEIASLTLNADLVVLSACNTAAAGAGRFGGGALEGLADAFFNAGARAVLASHWAVPSASTMRLMSDVFARVSRQPSRDLAVALKDSQLDLIADPATAHPIHWAAFSIIGDGVALAQTASNP